jgi:hypothetical protein
MARINICDAAVSERTKEQRRAPFIAPVAGMNWSRRYV